MARRRAATEVINMAWPRRSDAAWYVNYAMVLSTAIVIGLGLVYTRIGKPYDHGKGRLGMRGR
ncbi:hypothetical protein EMIT0347P_40241 [Pseudomonas sp. IT-347P]